MAAIRIISPPLVPASATRFELRVPGMRLSYHEGCDVNPYLAVAALVGSGLYGIKNKLSLSCKPLEEAAEGDLGERLAGNLQEAVVKMKESGSVARSVFGDEFIDHYVKTREHEWRLWSVAVTDWELKRYME